MSADEVERALPEAVSEHVWNRETGEKRKAVNYGALHSLHFEAFRDVDDRLSSLRKRVSALEEENERLKNQLSRGQS